MARLYWFFVALWGLLAACIVAISFQDIDFLLQKAKTLPFAQGVFVFYLAAPRALRIVALTWLAVPFCLFFFRAPLQKIFVKVKIDFRLLVADSKRYVSALLSERPFVSVLFLITAFGAALRFCFLNHVMCSDETGTFFLWQGIPFYLSVATYDTNHHMLFTWISKISILLFGEYPWAIRLPAFIPGILLIPASYILSRIWFGRSAAIFTAALVSFFPPLVAYSANARGYSLETLLVVFIFILVESLLKNRNLAAWFLLCLSAGLGLYVTPAITVAYGMLGVYVLFHIFRGKENRPIELLANFIQATAVVAVFTYLLYSPVFARGQLSKIVANEYIIPFPLSYLVRESPEIVRALHDYWHSHFPLWILVLFGFGLAVACVPMKKSAHAGLRLLGSVVLGMIVLILLKMILPPTRVLLFLAPIYLALVAAGWSRIFSGMGKWGSTWQRAGAVVGAATLVAMMGVISYRIVADEDFFFEPNSACLDTTHDMKQVAGYIADIIRPGDRVYGLNMESLVVRYYLRLRGQNATEVRTVELPLTFETPLGKDHRSLLVVRERDKENFLASWEQKILLKSFQYATVYEIGPAQR